MRRPRCPKSHASRSRASGAAFSHQICLGALAQITGTEDLSPLQFGVLASIQDEPGTDQRRLAERLGIDTVSAHHYVEFLEERGLVTREIDPDRSTLARPEADEAWRQITRTASPGNRRCA